MKVKVNRQLNAGEYHINFEVGDFTADEVKKMSSFGIPSIGLRWTQNTGNRSMAIPLTQISKVYDASFQNESDAKKYEESVLNQIREAMQRLRESQDKFTSSDEVAL
jgi:hypothetical protein